MKRLCCLVTVLPLLISFSLHAQEIGDTQNGLAWAQQVCSECHAGPVRNVVGISSGIISDKLVISYYAAR